MAPQFVDGIRELIAGARTTVARGVDLVQVHTNFEIGRRIVEEELRGEDRAAYGEEIVRALAERLTGEFGSGFSKSNIEYMRRFYLAYSDRDPQIAQTLTGQFDTPPPRPFTLGWSHYVFLLRIKDPMDGIAALDGESAEVLQTIRRLL
jgi:hypothetical protein